MKLSDVIKQRWRILIDSVWRFFISLRLTFVLLVIIGLGAILGMSFDQTITFEEFYQTRALDAWSTRALSFFELYDTFHSWWFSLAILFLAANLIACSIERLPRIYFDAVRPRPYLDNRRLLGLSLQHEMHTHSLSDAQNLIKSFHHSLKLQKKRHQQSLFYFADTKILGRFGVYIVHIALLIVMFSSIYTTQSGVDALVQIEEGKKTRFVRAKGAGGITYTHDLGFYIGCKDFRLRTFVDNSPMEYESDLFIEDTEARRLLDQTVRVNEPLSYAGYTFYQSSFQPLASDKIVEIEVRDRASFKKRVRLRLGEELKLDNGDVFIPEKLFEDFAGLGQAVRMQKRAPDKNTTYFHIFRRHPEFDDVVRNDSFILSLVDVDQEYATGLSIGKVPGISVIFSGFLLLLVGIFLCFFIVPIRYFARIDPAIDGYKLIFGAHGIRNNLAVREDFLRRIHLINQEKHHG